MLIDESVLMLNDKELTFIHTLGHTPGNICIKLGDKIYTGDFIFEGAVGRWDFPTVNQDVLCKSIIKFLDSLSDDIKLFPAHGKATIVGNEKVNNYFYRF
jgi:glyoxylase-like metal-dependent hydrolase (beta-lactamase superfamily II)